MSEAFINGVWCRNQIVLTHVLTSLALFLPGTCPTLKLLNTSPCLSPAPWRALESTVFPRLSLMLSKEQNFVNE